MTENKQKRPVGRPTRYSQAMARWICTQIADGLSLRTICSQPNAPAMSNIFVWLDKYPEFQEQYTRAKDNAADAMAEDMQHIADSADVESSTAVNKARLQVDTRKWIASKLKPKKYGDTKQLNVSGGITFDHLTEDQLLARMTQLIDKMGYKMIPKEDPDTIEYDADAQVIEDRATGNQVDAVQGGDQDIIV